MQLSSECKFRPTTEDLEAFNAHKKTPFLGVSGSEWGLKQLQHCYIDFKPDLEALQLLKSQDLLPENSVIAQHFIRDLSHDWQGILRSCADGHAHQPLSPLNHGLGQLASLPWSEHSYHKSSSPELQSSPPINRSPISPSQEQQRKTQTLAEYAQTPTRSPGASMWTSPSALPLSPGAACLTSNLAPAQLQGKGVVSGYQQSPPPSSPPEITTPFTDMASPPKFALSQQHINLRMRSPSIASGDMDLDEGASQSGYAQGSADWNPQPQLPTNKRDISSFSNAKLVPYSDSSSPAGHHGSPSAESNASLASGYNLGLEPVPEENKPENDVEHVARLLMEVVRDGMMAAALSPRGSDPGRWEIRAKICFKRSAEFQVNGYTITAHPDCTISLRVDDLQTPRSRDFFLHFEVKKLKHNLSPYEILGQELSELLAEAMRMKDHMRQELDTIPSWLISWHHLECYFSKLEVTREYLAQLSDTSGLDKQKPPLIRRSRRYNLRIPTDRVEVGLMYARIFLELMGIYYSIQKLGVVEQLQS